MIIFRFAVAVALLSTNTAYAAATKPTAPTPITTTNHASEANTDDLKADVDLFLESIQSADEATGCSGGRRSEKCWST